MAGGTFTITNVGVFGVDAGTPILNPGESGILAIGAIRKQPWVVGNKIKPRWVTTLALSFDHRIVDGEQGSRFLADVAHRRGPGQRPALLAPEQADARQCAPRRVITAETVRIAIARSRRGRQLST